MKNSSLFFFHKDSVLRQNLLGVVTTPEDIVSKQKAEDNPENYGITDIQKSQNLTVMNINEGKLITTQRRKNVAKAFELFIVVIILLSCILLCIDTPLNNPDTTFSKTVSAFDIIFSVIFLIEATMKILAFGFFQNSYQGISAYVFNAWNVLDFIVVVMSFVDIYFSYISSGGGGQNLNSFKALRAFRALRPLRMISRSEGLKIAIQALLGSIPAIGNVLII
jgi:hypothetical protein